VGRFSTTKEAPVNDVDDTDMAEELIGLILDFQERYLVGSEVIAPGKAEGPIELDPDLPEEEQLRKELLARATIWADRDAYNDVREELLKKMLAQVKVTLGSPGKDRGEAIGRFREFMEVEATRILLPFLEAQEQGPSPIS
jgi:hypothetical protein